MRIAEIFYSLQGEGELLGVPSVFVRTSGCNLRCIWCDTPYASWHPEGETLPVHAVLEKIRTYPARHVVLTGGEPLLAPELPDLAATLREEGYHITIETAGTLPPRGIACDLASLSPKGTNSTPPPGTADPAWIARHEATRWQPEVLRAWCQAYPFQFKWVVSTPEDAAAAVQAVREICPDLPPSKILLMPEGITSAELRARHWLIDFCLAGGYRYADRLHIHLFGNTRGT